MRATNARPDCERTADALLPRHQPYDVHLVVRVYLAEEDKTGAEADDTAATHSVVFSLEIHEYTILPPLAPVQVWRQQPPSYVRFPIVYVQWPTAAQIEVEDDQNSSAKGCTTTRTRLGQWHSEQQHASRDRRLYCFDNVSAQLESAADHWNFRRTEVDFEVNSRAREQCCDCLLALMGQVCKIRFYTDAKCNENDQVNKALGLVDRRWMKWTPRMSEAQHLDAGETEQYRAEYLRTLREIKAQHATFGAGAVGPSVQAMLAFLNTRAPNAAKVKAIVIGTDTQFMQEKQARTVTLFYQSFFDAHQPFGNMAEIFVDSFDLSAFTAPIGLPCRSGEWAFHNERTNEHLWVRAKFGTIIYTGGRKFYKRPFAGHLCVQRGPVPHCSDPIDDFYSDG